MTVTQDLFEVPGDALLARGEMDPLAALQDLQLSRVEQDQLRLTREESEGARTIVQVGLVLAAAFLLHRAYVARRTRAELAGVEPTSKLVASLALRNARNFIPGWVYMVTPALETALTYGQVRSEVPHVPDETIQNFARDYARQIAGYFNETSAEALVEGFNGFVNKKMATKAAVEKALDGYGLNRRQMRSVLTRILPGKVSSVLELDLDKDRHAFIDRLLVDRAYDMGDTESYNIAQQGQQLAWLYNVRRGRLPASARRIWLTAEDEKVCPVCGPLDKSQVPVDKPFETQYGKVWMPTLHPNCRCDVRLFVPRSESIIAKDLYGTRLADFNEDHPRQHDGRFRTKANQRKQAATMERPVDPTLDRLLREAQTPLAPPQAQLESPTAEVLDLGEGLDLSSGLNLGRGLNLGLNLGPLNLEQKLDLRAPQQGEELQLEPLNLPGLQLEALQLTAPAVEQMQLQARAQMSLQLQAPRPATRRATGGTIGLPQSMYYLDPSEFHFFTDSHHLVPDSDYASFGHNDEFTTFDNIEEQIEVIYNREIDRETRRVMNLGQNRLTDEDGNQSILPEDAVRGAFLAEITGDPRYPVLREYARRMGVKREDYTLVQFRLDEAYLEGFEGDTLAFEETEFMKVPGMYRIDSEERLTDQGWPLIVMSLEPEDEDERD